MWVRVHLPVSISSALLASARVSRALAIFHDLLGRRRSTGITAVSAHSILTTSIVQKRKLRQRVVK